MSGLQAPSIRFEYEETTDFDEVHRLAAQGWRVVAASLAYRDPYTAVTLYVLERPAGEAR